MSIILGNPMALIGKKKPDKPVVPKFTYTGDHTTREDGVVELKSSGVITFDEAYAIDLFMVGGGGAGGSDARNTIVGCGGGGGGYTRTVRNYSVTPNTQYNVIIGAGAEASRTVDKPTSGITSFDTISVAGGGSVQLNRSSSADYTNGANGGSGGGNGLYSKSTGGEGGSNGESGGLGSATSGSPTSGQGFTTKEFGEPSGKLYAGGGGGGTYFSAQSPVYALGGDGGGGDGAWGAGANKTQAAVAGGANTGGGGGGGVGVGGVANIIGGSGGSGIVCFRVAQELPGLVGVWVLNERLYPAATPFSAAVDCTATFTSTGISAWKNINVSNVFSLAKNSDGTGSYTLYRFKTNGWDNVRAGTVKSITFPVGATASNELLAWLASNATKK